MHMKDKDNIYKIMSSLWSYLFQHIKQKDFKQQVLKLCWIHTSSWVVGLLSSCNIWPTYGFVIPPGSIGTWSPCPSCINRRSMSRISVITSVQCKFMWEFIQLSNFEHGHWVYLAIQERFIGARYQWIPTVIPTN